jgi:hypothetical protein
VLHPNDRLLCVDTARLLSNYRFACSNLLFNLLDCNAVRLTVHPCFYALSLVPPFGTPRAIADLPRPVCVLAAAFIQEEDQQCVFVR